MPSPLSEIERSLKALNDEFKNMTIEVLKSEMTKIMKSQALEDEVWALKSDTLHNYGAYFSEHNPANIFMRYSEVSELFKSENIQKCKNHLFYETHRLDRYESLGEPVEIKRFDANENQAKAWKRLEEGTHTKEDLTWLKHEKAEQQYEQKHDAGYSESHEKAESHWSGTPWTNTEDKK